MLELTWFTKGLRRRVPSYHIQMIPPTVGIDLIYEGITTVEWTETISPVSRFLVGIDLIYEGITTGAWKIAAFAAAGPGWNWPDLRRDYDAGQLNLIIVHPQNVCWNWPDLRRDYDSVMPVIFAMIFRWNWPDLRRDYD